MPVLIFATAYSDADLQALREHVELVMEAARIPSIEKLAAVLEIDRKQLERQLDGEGHFSFSRIIGKLGKEPEFWPRYAWALIVRYGLPPEAQRIADMVTAYSFGRKQLRVDQKRSA